MKLTRNQLKNLIESLLNEQVMADQELKSNLRAPAKIMSIARGDDAHIVAVLESLGELQEKVQSMLCGNQDLFMENIVTTIEGMKNSFYPFADEKAKKAMDSMDAALSEVQGKLSSVCTVSPLKAENTFAQDTLNSLRDIAIAMDKKASNSPLSNKSLQMKDRGLSLILDELSKDEHLYAVEDAIKFIDNYIDVLSKSADMFKKGDIPVPEPKKTKTRAERQAEKEKQEEENLATLKNIFNTIREVPRGMQKLNDLIRKLEQIEEEADLDNTKSQVKTKEIIAKHREVYLVLDLFDTLADLAYDMLHPVDYFTDAFKNMKRPQYDEPADYIQY